MQTFVVHYYLAYDYNNWDEASTDDYFALKSYPLVGITNPKKSGIKELPFKVRPFELQQDKLFSLIKNSEKLAIKILKVEFDELFEPDIQEDMDEAIRSNDTNTILRLAEYVKISEQEIKSIAFMFENRQYKVTRYAVAEVTGEWSEIPTLTENTPIAIATGIKGLPIEGFGSQ